MSKAIINQRTKTLLALYIGFHSNFGKSCLVTFRFLDNNGTHFRLFLIGKTGNYLFIIFIFQGIQKKNKVIGGRRFRVFKVHGQTT